MNRLGPEQIDDLLKQTPAPAAVHLIGAGGCGMSGLGHLLLDLGYFVTGSDVVENEEIRQLRQRGADIRSGHAVANLTAARPFLVVYTPAVRLDNPEVMAAQQSNLPIVRRAVLLAALLRRQRGICVAGMHGKTTTSALLAFALDRLAARPSYAIGALVPQLARHARFSKAEVQVTTAPAEIAAERTQPFFVIEADESDGTLREFSPEHALVLNIDEEHLDYYAGFEAICEEFQRFSANTTGRFLYCADDPRLVELFAARPGAVSFGFNPLAKYRLESKGCTPGPTPNSLFEVWTGEQRVGHFSIGLIGEKNVSNTGAVVALLTELGYDADDIAQAIAPFHGAARRQQELFRNAQVRVFDDYGHHPREIVTTLHALKELGKGRLLVAFQPHRYTRTHHLLKDFAGAFREADKLWLTEVYAASEPEIPGVNGALLAETVRAQGQEVEYCAELGDLRRSMRAALQPGDTVLFLGAGDITRVAHELAAELRAEIKANVETLFQELQAQLTAGTLLRQDEPLARRTTLRVGGPADIYVEPVSETDLALVLKLANARGVTFRILGRGSNLVVRDGGVRGVVINLAHASFSQVKVDGVRLHCGAGAKLKEVSVIARRNGVAGLEFLEGIPGSVGGALRMNAGAMAAATFDRVESMRFMDYVGNIFERKAAEIEVRYRSCPLLKQHIALGAVFKGTADAREAIEQRMAAYSEKRWTSQPKDCSAGCMFKNPATAPAGRLIDELGLKGMRVGGACVSEVHGNFIVNDQNAKARDVLELIEQVKRRVRQARGLELETEVEIIGED